MKAFTYERADSPARAAAAAARPGAKLIAGGTNLLDLMKLQVETPTRLVDINRLPLDKIEDTPEGGAAHRRDGAKQRSRGRPSRASALWCPEPSVVGGCERTTAEQGHHRRQSAAADALLLFL
jgi:FAD binding domain in molybdopterin dehydrogenase